MRVLFANKHLYLPQRTGGIESSTHDLCLSLMARGLTPLVAAAVKTKDFRTTIGASNRLRRLLGRTHFPMDRYKGYSVYRGMRITEHVDEIASTTRPDVVVVQSGTATHIASAFADKGFPVVVYFRDAETMCLGTLLSNRNSVRFVANSTFVAEVYRSRFNVSSAVIPPLVRSDAYRTTRTGGYVTFINPVEKKGLRLAIELASRLPNIPFQFVESWPLDAKSWKGLKRVAAQLGNIKLRTRRMDMRSIYRGTRALLVPSQWKEAWGRVVTEAQFSGIPVIASDIGGLPESVGPGGLLVDSRADIGVWASAIEDLWSNEERYRSVSKSALAHSRRSEIDPERLVDHFVAILAELSYERAAVA